MAPNSPGAQTTAWCDAMRARELEPGVAFCLCGILGCGGTEVYKIHLPLTEPSEFPLKIIALDRSKGQ